MALVIAVAALKGGVGKSTITINLATCLHKAKHRVLIVDGDQQGTCRGRADVAAEAGHDVPPVVSMGGSSMRKDLKKVADGWDVVVIDAPPRLGTEQRNAMLEADVVLFPVTPGPADVWALQESLSVLEDARGLRPEIRAAIVLNRMDTRTGLSGVTKSATSKSGVPVLKATLGNRVAFAEAMATGQGVITYAPSSTAAKEMTALTRAVLGIMEKA